MSVVTQFTGGEVYYYSHFDVAQHGEKLYYELFRNLTRPSASEVMIKARCSKGLAISEYFGSFGLRDTADVKLAGIDADKSFGIALKHDEERKEEENVHV